MKAKTPDWCKDVNILSPEFKYIFTIDLKGRIVEEKLEKEKFNFNEEKFKKKECYDKNRCYKDESEVDLADDEIHLLRMEKSTIKSFVDPYLLEHATPFR